MRKLKIKPKPKRPIQAFREKLDALPINLGNHDQCQCRTVNECKCVDGAKQVSKPASNAMFEMFRELNSKSIEHTQKDREPLPLRKRLDVEKKAEFMSYSGK